jgi:peptide-methionine (S)-S-oxide reductase
MNKLITTYIVGFMVLGLTGTLYASEPQSSPEATEMKLKKATFAGGCFWCMEPPFDKLDGVISTTVGYSGGQEENPTYKQVSSGKTGHTETVEIVYDPSRVTYSELLYVFWRNIDPTQKDGQFYDTGPQYRTAIFYHDEEQKRFHQDYYKKNPIRYKLYRYGSGRDDYLVRKWGKQS